MDRNEGRSHLGNDPRLYSLKVLALALMLTSLACAGEQTVNSQSEEGGVTKDHKKAETTVPVASGDTAFGRANATRAGRDAAMDATDGSSVRASASAGAMGDVQHLNLNCRAQTYIIKEGMSRAEVKDFVARITYRVVANLDGSGNKNMGEILDDIGVPSYENFCG